MAKYTHPIFKSVLKERTLYLVQNCDRRITYASIAKATGLSEQWIGQFASSKLKSPDVGRIETLYNHLSDKPLKVI